MKNSKKSAKKATKSAKKTPAAAAKRARSPSGLTPLRAKLMRIIAKKPIYPQKIITASGGSVNRTSVYVVLGKIESAGFVKSTLTRLPGRGPERRVFSITARGAKALAEFAGKGGR